MNLYTPSKRVDIVKVKIVKESSILYKNRKVSTPKDAATLANIFLEDLDRESLIVITLDSKNQPNNVSICSIGTVNSSLVHPREIFKSAILSNASSIIIAHNHPSGDATESREDINISKRIYEAGKILGIELLDHIILGDNQLTSLKEKGVF